MSCNYADGLSAYENKGVLGLPEKFECPEKLEEKCKVLAALISNAKRVVVHTGAGISTSAGIPDFRGPNGVWTLERDGRKPNINISFGDAIPTKTHMALKKLVEERKVQYVISQNIDGLHLRSGLPRSHLAELHGNMFIEQCNVCSSQFVCAQPVSTVGQRSSGRACGALRASGRTCRGVRHDTILDWEHNLPESELDMAEMHSSLADLSICLGSTLQIIPSGTLPLLTLKNGGKLVICNLQPTKYDKRADLNINYYVDDILVKVLKHLGFEIPNHTTEDDPCQSAISQFIDWTIPSKWLADLKEVYTIQCKSGQKKINRVKRKREDLEHERKVVPIKNSFIKCENFEGDKTTLKTYDNRLNTANGVKSEDNSVKSEGNSEEFNVTSEDNDVKVNNVVQSNYNSINTGDNSIKPKEIVLESNENDVKIEDIGVTQNDIIVKSEANIVKSGYDSVICDDVSSNEVINKITHSHKITSSQLLEDK